jgi:aconitate hydratase 2/2-methylisocitrate dehydratase
MANPRKKAAKGDTVMAVSTRLFQGRVVEDAGRQKRRIFTITVDSSSGIVHNFGENTYNDEYKAAKGINLT